METQEKVTRRSRHRDEYASYLRSSKWRAKRRKVLKRDKNKCRCGNRATEVHHKTYERVYNERVDDLISVCRDCHQAIHDHVAATGANLEAATKKVLKRRSQAPKCRKKLRGEADSTALKRMAKKDFEPFRPPVGGGFPVKRVTATGEVKRHTQVPPERPKLRQPQPAKKKSAVDRQIAKALRREEAARRKRREAEGIVHSVGL